MNSAYTACIEACLHCVAACENCAASCLREEDTAMMKTCIQLDLECAEICRTTAVLLNLQSEHANAITQICADMCNACAEECSKHKPQHCQECAAACRHCAEECLLLVAADASH